MPYWPDSNGSKEVGQYVITIKSEREAADYKVRVLEIFPVQQVTFQNASHSRSFLKSVEND